MESLGQFSSTVVGGRLPNDAIFISTSGPIPFDVTGSLGEASQRAGGVGAKMGTTTVGCCGEFHTANTLLKTYPQYLPSDIKWTDAIRPRGMTVIDMCDACKLTLGK